ncbi:cytochrome P450 [Dactylosporangium sp. NPDC000555]|uniref:cytochrome P450 n=1 Tax=Dactylosporangium sp. NPDC000555 TaxID=3154260 RepID=UPI00331864F9
MAVDTPPDAVPHLNYDPFSLPQRDHPYPVWSAMRDEAPVLWSDVVNAWVVTRYADAVRIIADTETFRNEGSTRSLATPPREVSDVLATGLPRDELRSTQDLDGPEHARIRKFLAAILTPRRIGGLAPRAREIADDLLAPMVERGGGDFVADFAYRLPLALITQLLGIPEEDGERLHHWSTQKMALQWGRLDPQDHVRAAQDYVDFQNYLVDLVQRRRAEPTGDVVSAFTQLRMPDERPLTDTEIVGQMMGLIAAGHETTTNFLGLTMWRLLENREVWRSVCANPSLIPGLVEEGLRLESPAGIWRRTSRAVTLHGTEIPAGARVQVLLPAANRDTDAFPSADVLDVHRGPEHPHLAFGRGIHYCIGAGLARIEGKAAFESLVTAAPGIRLAEGFVAHFKPNASQRYLECLTVEIGSPQ